MLSITCDNSDCLFVAVHCDALNVTSIQSTNDESDLFLVQHTHLCDAERTISVNTKVTYEAFFGCFDDLREVNIHIVGQHKQVSVGDRYERCADELRL